MKPPRPQTVSFELNQDADRHTVFSPLYHVPIGSFVLNPKATLSWESENDNLALEVRGQNAGEIADSIRRYLLHKYPSK